MSLFLENHDGVNATYFCVDVGIMIRMYISYQHNIILLEYIEQRSIFNTR